MGQKSLMTLFLASLSGVMSLWAVEPPQSVVSNFTARYQNTSPTWEKATGMYLAAFSRNGQSVKAAFKEDGTFLREDVLISFSALPAAVRADASQRFGEANILEAATFTDANGAIGYRIRYQKGNARVDVMYNAQNTIFQRAIIE
jgi:hypothetical protein